MANAKTKKRGSALTRRKSPQRKRVGARPAAPTPWWLRAEIEVCIFCSQGYAHGAGYRCPACDAAVCMFCVEERSGEFFCPEC